MKLITVIGAVFLCLHAVRSQHCDGKDQDCDSVLDKPGDRQADSKPDPGVDDPPKASVKPKPAGMTGEYTDPADQNDFEKTVTDMIERSLHVDCTKVLPNLAKLKTENGGVFAIYPSSYKTGTEVYCDRVTDGGGWTIFQRRIDGSLNFDRSWEDYVKGFGTPDKEYWMGLEKLYRLTSDGDYELRIELEDWNGDKRYAIYSTFSIAGASDKYRIQVEEYTGDAGDALSQHNNQQFSSPDQDNDGDPDRHCAKLYQGGWWHSDCFTSHLNGVYHDPKSGKLEEGKGILWNTWTGSQDSRKVTEMKFRPLE